MNSRQKGKRGELELSHKLNELGFETRRSVQYCGANGDADVIGIPGVHIECKRVESLNIHKAMEQASNDAREGEAPAVFHRRNGREWLVTMRLPDWAVREKHYIKEQEGTMNGKNKCIASQGGECRNIFGLGMKCNGHITGCRMKPHYDSLEKTANAVQESLRRAFGLKSDRQ